MLLRLVWCIVFFLTGSCLLAAEFARLEITPLSAKEVIEKSWGAAGCFKISTEKQNTVIELSDRGALKTKTFPYFGQEILIEAELKCRDLVQGNKPWDIALLNIYGNDASGKVITHESVASVKDTTVGWKHCKRSLKFTSAVKSIHFGFVNLGKSGTAWFRNPVFSLRMPEFERLVEDPGFENVLDKDTWFIQRSGKDWDRLSLGGRVLPVEDLKHSVSGNKCIRFDAPGTVDSQVFKYNGEELLLCGWIRTEKITRGKKAWCGAGVTAVGCDQNKNYVSHQDLKITFGTKPWTFFLRKIRFPKSVKHIYCRFRVFAGARGKAWFDDITLLRNKGGIVNKPFDAAKSQVLINASKPEEKEIRPIWNGVDGLYPHWLMSKPHYKEALDKTQAAGFKWLRIRAVMHDGATRFYIRDDKHGNPIYDWTKFDSFFDAMVKDRGFRLSIGIDTIPVPLTRKGVTPGSYKMNPPADYKKWSACVEAMLKHLVERYGKTTVEGWRFHVWNEPVSFKKDPAEEEPFLKLYDGVMEAVKRVENKFDMDIKLGLTSGGHTLNEEILAHLANSGNADNIDVMAFHAYAGAQVPLIRLTEMVELHRDLKKRYKLKDTVEIWCQEYNTSSMARIFNDSSFSAAAVIDATRQWLDAGLTQSTFFALRDWPNFQKEFFLKGSCGMMTKTAVPKASYHSFVFLNELVGGKRLPLKSSNLPVNGIAVVNQDNKSIKAIVYSVDEDFSRTPYTTDVTVKIKLPENALSCKAVKYWQIDREHGDIATLWKKLGKPTTDRKKIDRIKAAAKFAKFPPEKLKAETENGIATLRLSLPSQSVAFVEVETVKE